MNLPAAGTGQPPDAATMDALIDRYQKGHHAEVLEAARALTRQAPDHGFGWKLLGAAAQRLGHVEESLAAKRRAAQLLPQDADVHNNLGNALAAVGRLAEAEGVLRHALALKPGLAEAHNNLGLVLLRQGRVGEAEAAFRAAISARAGYAEAHSNLLFMLSHDADIEPQRLLQEHLAFDRLQGEPLRGSWRPHDNPRDPHKRLRVGFVSGDLRQHAVAHFIAPIWRELDPQQVEVVAYSTSPRGDDMTQALRALCAQWVDAAALDDAALAERIRADGIDILVDLSGHTRLNRLGVFARKPAPLQVTAIGYPHTTGLRAMDYRVSDVWRMPPGRGLEAQQVEQVVRIPSSGTFEHGPAPDVGPLPALAHGYLTFGSFQRAAKLNAATLALWARVLHALPGARLLLGAIADGAARRRVAGELRAQGVAADRFEFLPPRPMQEYLAMHQRIDILLDSYPYPGGTTTQHGLWMGVPTITRTGPPLISWQGAATLLRLGLDAWVTDSDEAFVRCAVQASQHLDALAALRAGLRERITHNTLMHPRTVARGMQAAWRAMWQRWCAGLPPASFEVTP